MELVKRFEAPDLFRGIVTNGAEGFTPNGGGSDDRDIFHVTYDPEIEPVGQVIVESVAAVKNREIADLDPLYDSIDPEALDELLSAEANQGGVDEVTFEYEEMVVMTGSSGDLWLKWQ